MVKPTIDRAFDDWKEREALAEAMIPLIGKLYRRNVVLYMHGVPLFNESVIEIMRIHRRVRQIEKNELFFFIMKVNRPKAGPHLDFFLATMNHEEVLK